MSIDSQKKDPFLKQLGENIKKNLKLILYYISQVIITVVVIWTDLLRELLPDSSLGRAINQTAVVIQIGVAFIVPLIFGRKSEADLETEREIQAEYTRVLIRNEGMRIASKANLQYSDNETDYGLYKTTKKNLPDPYNK